MTDQLPDFEGMLKSFTDDVNAHTRELFREADAKQEVDRRNVAELLRRLERLENLKGPR